MSAPVRIELLQVQFDVIGDGEDEFARLFERYINQWSRIQNDREHRQRALECERLVGDRRNGRR